MKLFIARVSFFVLLFFALDKTLMLFRDRLPERELDKRLERLIKGEIHSSVVILGSSRGARDVMASQLADSLRQDAINLSYPGSDVTFHEYLLDALLEHGNTKPDVVLLAVDDPSEISKEPTLQFRYDRLYPLVKYKSVRNTLVNKGEKNAVLSNLFIIHQLSVGSLDFRKKKFNPQDTLHVDGSMPISWQSQKFSRTFEEKVTTYDRQNEDAEKIASLKNIVNTCSVNDIHLVLVCPPNFSNPTPGFVDRLESFCRGNAMIMKYDASNPVYKNADYYFDPAHLKLNGATIFTTEIVSFIRQNGIFNTMRKSNDYVSRTD
jgi:hypothetical protein